MIKFFSSLKILHSCLLDFKASINLKGYQDSYFQHFLRISDDIALSGEAISGHHSEGQYVLTKNKEMLRYIKKRGERLLAKATPLMKIYRQDSINEFHSFLVSDFGQNGFSYKNILSAPPLYSISSDLLEQLLKHNNIYGAEKKEIILFMEEYKKGFEKCTLENTICDELSFLSEEEFNAYPAVLPLTDIFYEKEITYTYDIYKKHIEQTLLLADKISNYKCTLTKQSTFRNIQIRIAEGECAILSKSKAPAIHFVIKHTKLRQAIEDMIIPTI